MSNTYASAEKYNTATFPVKTLRVIPEKIQAKSFSAGVLGAVLAILTPITFNETLGLFQVWSGKHNEIYTIGTSGTISGGNFTITVNGETTANIAHSASAATVQAALEALGTVQVGDVTVTGGPLSTNTSLVLTFKGQYRNRAITVSATLGGLTGGGTNFQAHTQAGVNSTGIEGFIWPDPVTLDGTNAVLGQVLMSGEIHYGEIVLPAGESEADLKEYLLNGSVRRKDFMIQGLPNFR